MVQEDQPVVQEDQPAAARQVVMEMVHRAVANDDPRLRIGSIDHLTFMAVVILISKPCLAKNAAVAEL